MTSHHNIVFTTILLRVAVQDSRVRLLDFRKTNFQGMRRELGAVDLEKFGRLGGGRRKHSARQL